MHACMYVCTYVHCVYNADPHMYDHIPSSTESFPKRGPADGLVGLRSRLGAREPHGPGPQGIGGGGGGFQTSCDLELYYLGSYWGLMAFNSDL